MHKSKAINNDYYLSLYINIIFLYIYLLSRTRFFSLYSVYVAHSDQFITFVVSIKHIWNHAENTVWNT